MLKAKKEKEIRWQPYITDKTPWTKTGVSDDFRIPETHENELVYCKKETLKYFQKNKIYKIKAITKTNHYTLKVKFEGINGLHNWNNFDFIENNVALLRDFNINQLMDIDNDVSSTVEGRKLDTMTNKNFTLIQMLMWDLQCRIGSVGSTPNSISYDNFIEFLVKKHNKYGVNATDFNELCAMPLKEIIQFFDI